MAIGVSIETTIARSPEDTFAALADLDAWPGWLIATGIVGVIRAAPGSPVVAGEHVVIDQRAQGRASLVEATVSAFEPPTRFAIDGRDADGVRTSLDARLLPGDGGATRLRWSVHIDLPLRYRVFESMAAPMVQRAATLDIEAFKRRLESAGRD
jgi:uncharacterized protein YndB with AHSA1/START domain